MANNILHENENALLDKAILFAVEHHAGALRKGSKLPYIIHPLETMQILYSMKAGLPLMIAGVLHDTVEDTDATIDEIITLFGPEIGALVAAHTEDKSLSWHERKQHTIEKLETASVPVKMLIMADKVSNLRSLAADSREIGDEIWQKFNAPKEMQAWYYSEILNALRDFQNHKETAAVYWEMADLYKDVFYQPITKKAANT